MKFHEIRCKSALHKLKRKMPYQWDLNIYRGCQHGCRYCYAQYSHNYLNSSNFFSEVSIKTNIVEELEKELKANSWKQEIINIGGVTDSYQQVEEKYKLMPDILRLLIKYRTPAIISTKSDLILRDYYLIDQLSRYTYVNIATTIISTDNTINNQLEPGAVSYNRRFNILSEFKNSSVSTGLHIMPIIPYITDSKENLESLLSMGNESKVDYVLPGTLYLKGQTRPFFFNYIKDKFPDRYKLLTNLYSCGSANNNYKTELYKRFNLLKNKYELSSSYSKPIKERLKKPEDSYYNRLLF